MKRSILSIAIAALLTGCFDSGGSSGSGSPSTSPANDAPVIDAIQNEIITDKPVEIPVIANDKNGDKLFYALNLNSAVERHRSAA